MTISPVFDPLAGDGAAPGTVSQATLVDDLFEVYLSGTPYFDECEYPVNASTIPYFSSTAGAGAVVAAFSGTNMATHPGQVEYGSGTTSTGRVGARTHTSAYQFSGGRARFRIIPYMTTLSDVAERYAFIAGFFNTPTAIDQGHGAFFEYDEGGVAGGGSASPNWKCVTADNAARTRTTTTVAVTAGVFQKLEIDVNAAGTEVVFKIGGVVVATHTTNIPTLSSRRTGTGFHLIKSIGTTARTFVVDQIAHHVTCTAR